MTADKLASLRGACDLVVADVPCSGSGRWRRAPETKWRLTPAELDNLKRAQADILAKAATHVKPGGRLAYITCSIFDSENAQQVDKFIKENQMFVPDEGVSWQDQSAKIQLHPAAHDTDGLFIAILRHKES